MTNKDLLRFTTKGKREDTGEWVSGSYFPCKVNGEITDYIIVGKESADNNQNNNSFAEAISGFHKIIPETRSQGTGASDETDTAIFENDIVLVEGAYYKVSYSENSGFVLYNGRNCTRLLPLYISQLAGIKVCGNIFDNPGLLE